MDINKTVYLAGPIHGQRVEDALRWRAEATTYFSGRGIITLSPLRHKLLMTSSKGVADPIHLIARDKAIHARDKNDVKRSGAVLMNLLNTTIVSIGSVVEVGWCDAYDIPLIVVMENGSIHDHGMLRAIAAARFSDMREALEFTAGLILPDYQSEYEAGHVFKEPILALT
jgi:nucleoside 2-deoxyribosyltransferase